MSKTMDILGIVQFQTDIWNRNLPYPKSERRSFV
jgi:hypothetical protein